MAPPILIDAPEWTGTVQVLQDLIASEGVWIDADTYDYKWQRSDDGVYFTDISGATSNTYVIQVADIDKSIRCHVTATNADGSTAATTDVIPGPNSGSDGGMHTFAVTIDGSNNVLIYLDGALLPDIEYTASGGAHVEKLIIGSGEAGSGAQDQGGHTFDSVRIFKRVLSGAEIAAIENGGGPSDDDAKWLFNGNADDSVGSLDLTLPTGATVDSSTLVIDDVSRTAAGAYRDAPSTIVSTNQTIWGRFSIAHDYSAGEPSRHLVRLPRPGGGNDIQIYLARYGSMGGLQSAVYADDEWDFTVFLGNGGGPIWFPRVTIPATDSTGAIVSPSMVAHWKLDDLAASTTAVEEISGADGTIAGTTAEFGDTPEVGTGALFLGDPPVGAGNYLTEPYGVSVPTADIAPALSDLFTAVTWVKIRDILSIAAGERHIILSARGTDGAGWQLACTGGTDPKFVARYFSTSVVTEVTEAVGSAVADTYAHIACSYDPVTREARLWVNGVRSVTATISAPNAMTEPVGEPFYMGRPHGAPSSGNGYNLLGSLDDVRLYNRVLTDAQMLDLYNGGEIIDPTETPAQPENTTAPVITGTTEVGEDLSCTTGIWTGSGTLTLTFRWQRSSGGGYTTIADANGNTYTLVAADAGRKIRCLVTATNDEGSTGQLSNVVGPITDPSGETTEEPDDPTTHSPGTGDGSDDTSETVGPNWHDPNADPYTGEEASIWSLGEWRTVLCDKNGRALQIISQIASKQELHFVLNRPARFSFTVPSDDDMIATPCAQDGRPMLEEMIRTVKVYRREWATDGTSNFRLRFAGTVVQVNDTATEDGVVHTDVVCFDPLWKMQRRAVRNAAGNVKRVTFSASDHASIIAELVDRTNTHAGKSGLTRSGGALIATGITDRVTFDRVSVADAMRNLTDTYGGTDITIDPLNRQDGILGRLNIWGGGYGVQKRNAVFAWGCSPNNVKNVGKLADGSQVANWINMSGSPKSNGAAPTYTVDDDASIADYGQLEAVESVQFEDTDIIEDLTDAELNLRKRARVMISFTPQPGISPMPWVHWRLGDTIKVAAGRQLRGGFEGEMRVFGFTIQIADETGGEVVSEIICSPGAGE